MRVIMFDRQSIFIHGTIGSLQKCIPEINITGTSQTEELWEQLSASPSAIVMIDGRFIQDDGMALLEALLYRFPATRVVMMLVKKEVGGICFGSPTIIACLARANALTASQVGSCEASSKINKSKCLGSASKYCATEIGLINMQGAMRGSKTGIWSNRRRMLMPTPSR